MMDGDLNFETDPDTGDVLFKNTKELEGIPNPGSDQVELVGALSDRTIDMLATSLTESLAHDERAGEAKQRQNADILELLGAGPESREDDDDDEASDTSDHPLMLLSLLRFQAKAYSTLLPSDDTAVRTKPSMNLDMFSDPKEREEMQTQTTEAGSRVERFYTEYLFERLPSYEEDTDLILHDMGLFGLGIRKIGVDRTNEDTPVTAEYVPLENLMLSYDSKNMRTGRITHRIDMPVVELVRRMASGFYRPIALQPGVGGEAGDVVTEGRDRIAGLDNTDPDATHRIYECHCELFLTEDKHPKGLARPYIVTIHAQSQQVLSVQRNWKETDKNEAPIEHFVGYIYHPGKNAATGLGLGALLGNVTRALRRAQRRGFEAAYLQNHPSGFKLSSLSIRDDSTRVKRGEFVDVDTPTDDIRAALMAHPFQGPSQGLMALADKLEESGRELGGTASIDFAQMMKSGVAAGPAMAAFEESSEFQTSVHRRLYKANRKELKLIHDRMREAFGNKEIVFAEGQEVVHGGDLMMVDVIPYMKPGQVSRQKMILEAQAIYEMATAMPDVINKRTAAEEYLRALGKNNLDDLLLPDPADEENAPQPSDPVTEYSMVVNGRPVKAGENQNHAAHIDAHVSQMRMMIEGQMPIEQGQAAAAAMSAHIVEHIGMQMMSEVAARIGIPPEQLAQAGQDPQQEAQLSLQIAQATQQIEAERNARKEDAPQQEESKIAIEQTKQQGQAALETLRQQGRSAELAQKQSHDVELAAIKIDHDTQLAEVKAAQDAELHEINNAHALELQAVKDEAAMAREVEDNTSAITIATLGGGSNNASAKAGSRQGGR